MNVSSQFTLNFKDILIEEVALEGLEGITLEVLWKRIEKRISRSLPKLFYARLWSFALHNEDIHIFELPEPRQTIELINRIDILCEGGLLRDPPDYLDGPYEYCPVPNDHGSCKDYATRRPIDKDELIKSSFDFIVSTYGNRLVLVASFKERWKALVPHLPQKNIELISGINYCILELIGKSRDNGQASIGKSNLLKVMNNAQLFYSRKLLCKLDFIKQIRVYVKITSTYMRPYILKLKRFHVPALFVTPRIGKFVDLISHLKTKPNYTDTVDNLKKLSLPLPTYTKTNKKCATLFKREKAANEDEPPIKKIKKKPRPDDYVIRLNIETDSESESETEIEDVTKPCEHMVGVNLYRQAYELILNAGSRGLSAMEFRKELGVGFYSGRTILKWFRSKNIVNEFFEERGRQRLGRYAVTNAIFDDMKAEKDKLLQYFMETSVKRENDSFDEPSTSAVPIHSTDDCSDSLNQTVESCDTSFEFKANVSEVDVIKEGSAYKDLIESKKKTSIRQLKLANAILKITREKRVIAGFRTLNTLAANEINTVAMDNKHFASFLYKLAKDCQIKIYDLKWPTSQSKVPKNTLIICAPDVKLNDPVIKAKYNEICFRSNLSKYLDADSKQLLGIASEEQAEDPAGVSTASGKSKSNSCEKPLDLIEKGHQMRTITLQRYRRIQKLHEFIFDLVYGGHSETTHPHAPGFVSMTSLIQEMPVRLILGHFSKISLLKLGTFAIKSDMLDMKLKDTPPVLLSALSSKAFLVILFDTINILATFGLVQICIPSKNAEHYHTGSFRYIFYVNRNTKIIDTRGVWPRENDEVETLKQVFYLETQQDVKSYWQTVHDIAVNTKVARHAKRWSLPPTKVQKESEAPEQDTGQIFGDGAGACGFDSVYFLDQQKHWEVIATEMLNKENVKFLPRPQKVKTIAKKKKLPKKTAVTLKTQLPPKNRTRNRAVKAVKEPLIKWSSWEDNILMLVRTAHLILSPNSQPGSTAIRNTVARLLINKRNKSGSICHKRILTLENQVALSFKRECLLKEIRRQKDIISKYDDLYTVLRYKHAKSESNYLREGELATLELVFILYKISKSETFLDRSTPCVASSLQDFYSKFEIKAASDNKPLTMYHLNVSPAEVQALREAVLMAMTSVEEMEVSIETTMKIFNCLSSYNENYLREAVDQLRNSGVIAAKEKYLHQHLSNFTFHDLIRVTTSYMKAMSAFRLSAIYRKRQTGRMNSSFGDDLADTLKNADLSGKIRSSAEINCVCFELNASNALDIETVTAPSVVEISRDGSSKNEDKNSEEDTRSVVNAGYVEVRKKVPVKSLTELFDALDFTSLFQTLIQKNIVRQATGAPPRTDKIINYLKTAGQDGATFKDLQKIWTSDTKSLIRKLERLEKENFITHVGFMDNLVVLSEFAHLWCIKVGDVSLMPCPWLTGDIIINKHFFMKWCGTIVNKVFEYPGIAISRLVSEHCDVLAPRYVQQCCEFLQAMKCVNLNYVNMNSLDLFSEDNSAFELIDYCKYGATDCLVIFPVGNMLTRFSHYKSLILRDT